jgi:hypothetical protein
MTMISLQSLMILLIAAVAFSSVDAGTASQQKMIQPRAGSKSKFQALHQMFSIGDNPNENIHTNILINMEGI